MHFQRNFDFQRTSGPWNHLCTYLVSSISSSLEQSFAYVHSHCELSVWILIWCIRFAAKVLNRFFVFWIYPQTTLLPVQSTSHVFSCQVLLTIEQQFSLPMLQLAGVCHLFSSLLTLSNIIFLSLCVFCHLHYFYYFLCVLQTGLKLIQSSLHICRFFKWATFVK